MIKPKKKIKSTMRVVKITAYNIPTEDKPRVIIKKTGGKPKLITKLILIHQKSLVRRLDSN